MSLGLFKNVVIQTSFQEQIDGITMGIFRTMIENHSSILFVHDNRIDAVASISEILKEYGYFILKGKLIEERKKRSWFEKTFKLKNKKITNRQYMLIAIRRSRLAWNKLM